MDRHALLDANVIYPVWLCDLLLWSAEILDEARRNIIEDNPGVEPARIEARFAAMRRHFPEAMVEGHEAAIPTMANDPKDRHVLAAAIVGEADLIVTGNIRDFPSHSRKPHEIEADTADGFVCEILHESPHETLMSLKTWREALQNPPLSVEDILTRLERSAPNFCEATRKIQ